MIYLRLLWAFIQIGLFSIGGGYAALPLIQGQVVELNGWLTMTEYADVVTLSQMTPGPIAINAATFVGIRIAGIPGAIVSTLGCVLPSCVIVLILAKIYIKYRNLSVMQKVLGTLRPAVVGLIGAAGVSMMIMAFWSNGTPSLDIHAVDWISVALFGIALVVLRKWKVNQIYVMLAAGALGWVAYTLL